MDQQMSASDVLENLYKFYLEERSILIEKFQQILTKINEVKSYVSNSKAIELIMWYGKMREIEYEHHELSKYALTTGVAANGINYAYTNNCVELLRLQKLYEKYMQILYDFLETRNTIDKDDSNEKKRGLGKDSHMDTVSKKHQPNPDNFVTRMLEQGHTFETSSYGKFIDVTALKVHKLDLPYCNNITDSTHTENIPTKFSKSKKNRQSNKNSFKKKHRYSSNNCGSSRKHNRNKHHYISSNSKRKH